MAHNYDQTEVDLQFDYGLKNRASSSGKVRSVASIIYDAKRNGYQVPKQASSGTQREECPPFELMDGVPSYSKNGMDPQDFIGPKVGQAQLFPASSISLFVAGGSVGKTTSLMAIACHIAAGKPWNDKFLLQRRGIMFSVEETQNELDRKFGASIADWPIQSVRKAQGNFLVYSMTGRDPRLTRSVGRDVQSTGLSAEIIKIALEHHAKFIILDHLQGMVSGDLNNSDTMVAFAQECNRIATATGAAVIIAAHTTKANLKAETVEHGFSTGSLSIENAARQVVGLIPLPEAEAKAFGLDSVRKNYIRVEMPKNSYGPGGEVSYFAKCYVDKFHTVNVVPYNPPLVSAAPFLSGEQRLQNFILEKISNNSAMTSGAFDKISGAKGELKATRKNVRDALETMKQLNLIEEITLTKQDKKHRGLKCQVTKVYRLKE